MNNHIRSVCPICLNSVDFFSEDDFWSCRDGLLSSDCPYGQCVTRERALAEALFSILERDFVFRARIHEAAPAGRGLSRYLNENCRYYVKSGFFPGKPWGSMNNGLRNEDLENQTFENESFDIVLHLDVLEHLFNPFLALREIFRTLSPGGYCFFTAPTEHSQFKSRQVAFNNNDGLITYASQPKYHGNPQMPSEGSLVTWEYGYDLPWLIQKATNFDIEVRRYQSRSNAVMGYMNEVYVCSKPLSASSD